MVAGGGALEAEATASGDAVEIEATSAEAVETTVEADSGSSSSFSYKDSKETVSETRPEVGLDEAGPVEVPEARPIDPFIVQFGEDDGWWWNMVDFFRQEVEGNALSEYRERGYLPEAVVNFLALLGWSPGDDREVMTRDELVSAFSLERISGGNAVFDVEKLAWFNHQHLLRLSDDELFSLSSLFSSFLSFSAFFASLFFFFFFSFSLFFSPDFFCCSLFF